MRITPIPIACTELDGSGELVQDPSCPSSMVPDLSAQLSPSLTGFYSSQQNSGTLAITVGSVCAAVAVLLLVVISVVMVMWIAIKKHTHRKRQCISESWSPERYY